MTYGLPYMGSKNFIAKDIIGVLPGGERLVDLFGGGGAITHCAIESDKWAGVLYNDYNPLVVDLLRDAVAGKYNPAVFHPEWISRERFNEEKDRDGYIKYVWSFGGNGQNYLYGRDVESKKHDLFELVVNRTPADWLDFTPEGDTIRERRLSLKTYMRQNKSRNDLQNLERLERLENLQRTERLQDLESLERLEGLEKLQSLEFLNIDYRDYIYETGDVVYCDIPYEGVGKYETKKGSEFDHAAFYEWAVSRKYHVYFSSYFLPQFSDNVVWQKEKRCSFSPASNITKTIEYLYKVGGE